MNNDFKTDSKAFTASCALHFGLCGAFLLAALKFQQPPEPPKEIFELIAAPVPADPTAKTVTSPANAPTMPKFVRIKEQPLIFAKPEPIEPAPTPPKPADRTPDKPAPKESVKPKNQQQSFDEFSKNNPQPKTPSKPSPNRPAPQVTFNIPGTQPGKLAAPMHGELNIPVSQSDINLFMSLYGQRVKQAWRKPPTYAQIECEVSFDVSASGVVSNIRLHKSSGDSAFDQAALDALRAVPHAGRPPMGKPLGPNFMTFNTRE